MPNTGLVSRARKNDLQVMSNDEGREPAPAGRPSGLRTILTRDQIVAAAVRIIDADGVDALTMRRLAVELGSGVMSVYRHVRDRNELLDLVFDAVLSEIELAERNAWEVALVDVARSLRAVLHRHPNMVDILGSRPALGAHGLDLLERIFGVLRADGFSDVHAFRATSLLVSYVFGNILLQLLNATGRVQGAGGTYQPLRDALLRGFPTSEYPSLMAVVPGLADSEDGDFEHGLQAIIRGIRLGRADA
jgi:AcrR family transcriptional regulator